MPIYEYQCQSCEHSLEKLQKISDSPLVDCPACEKPTLKKQVTAGAFRLSGSGWYETDFKTGNKKNLAGSSSSDRSGGSAQPKKSDGQSSTNGAGENKGSKTATAKAE